MVRNCLLRDAMDDPTAKELVNRAHGKHETYDRVVADLKSEYDRCRTVYLKHAHKLFKRNTYDYTQKDMKALVERIEVNMQGMERCKGYTLDQYVAAQVELQMGDEMKQDWGVYSGDIENPDEPKRVSRSTITTPAKSRDPRKATVFRMQETPSTPTCRACDKAHPTYLCDVLKGTAARYALVRGSGQGTPRHVLSSDPWSSEGQQHHNKA